MVIVYWIYFYLFRLQRFIIVLSALIGKYKKIKEFHKVKKLSDLIIKTAFCEIMLETDSKGVSHKYLKLKNIEDNHTKT